MFIKFIIYGKLIKETLSNQLTTTYGTVEFGYNLLNYITSIKDGNSNVIKHITPAY